MPGVGLRPLPLLPPGSLASQVCSSSQELCRLPQRRPLPRETPDSLRRLVTGMRIRSGRKCCPAAPRRWSLCPLVCVASVAHRFLPTDLKLYALLSLCVGRGRRSAAPSHRPEAGSLLLHACCSCAVATQSPAQSPAQSPPASLRCRRRYRSGCIFSTGEPAAATRAPPASPRRCLVACRPCLHVRPTLSVVELGSFRHALCSCVITGLRKLLQLYSKYDSR